MRIIRHQRVSLRELRRLLHLLVMVLRGYRTFRRTGATPDEAYHGMRELFWRTDGRFNDVWTGLARFGHRPYRLALDESIFREDVTRIVGDLNRRGYCVFAHRLSDAICDDLRQFAKRLRYQTLLPPLPGKFLIRYSDDLVPYDPLRVTSPQYNALQQSLIEHSTIQRLVTDPVLLDISQRYFRARPVFDFVALWWNTSYLKAASSEAAQLYHFDMDRLKFLKFFIYLTDVGPQNGPHIYVAGSHRRKPRELHKDGRFSDQEVERHYNPADIIEIAGPRGTVFVADTRGFHKGMAPIADDRLLLQLEFATSLFGQTYQPVHISEAFTESFKTALENYPETYAGSVRSAAKD